MRLKNQILYFGLALNGLFYLGTTFFIVKHNATSQRQFLSEPFVQSLQKIHSYLLEDQTQVVQSVELAAKKTSLIEKKQFFENMPNVTTVLYFNEGLASPIIGQATDWPFQHEDYYKQFTTVHKSQGSIFISYVIKPKEAQNPDERFIVILKKPIELIRTKQKLEDFAMTVVESENQDRLIIDSSLGKAQAEELLKIHNFENAKLIHVEDKEDLKNNVETLTLQNEKYFSLPIAISFDKKIKQQVVYSLKIPDYQILDASSMLLILFTLFCLCTTITVVTYWKTNNNDINS